MIASSFSGLGWTVHTLPAPMNQWQGTIILSLFGLSAVGLWMPCMAATGIAAAEEAMDPEDERLDRLEKLLQARPVENEPMTVSELDGFVTGVLACPEMIPLSAWLSRVWGVTGDAEFPDLKAAEETIGAVMAHNNDVAVQITATLRVEPIYEVDVNKRRDPLGTLGRWVHPSDGITTGCLARASRSRR